MFELLAYYAASICYLVVFIWLLYCLITKVPIYRVANMTLSVIGLCCHLFVLYPHIMTPAGLNLNVFNVSSLISVFLVCYFIILCVYRPIITLGILASPVALLGLTIGVFGQAEYKPLTDISQGLVAHIFLSIAAYSMLLMSAVHAVILQLQIRELKHNTSQRLWVSSLPSLQTMETLLFDMLIIGFSLLTVALAIGFVYVDNFLTQHIAHKTLFSVLSWMLFLFLIFAHWRFGWRGKRASTFTLYSFTLLAVGFVGSKIVLELIL